MKKISILSLHLGYGGVEKAIVTLANLLAEKYQVEIACVYKLYEQPVFSLNPKVHIQYLTDLKPNRNEFMEAFQKKDLFRCLREGRKSLKVLASRKKSMVHYIKNTECDVMIATRDIFDAWLGKYGRSNVIKIGWEHNHYHGNLKYAKKIVKANSRLDYLVLVSRELQKFYSEKLKNSTCECLYIPNVVDKIPSNVSLLDEKRLVSVGRLSPEKGYLDLLSIFCKIVEDDSEWVLEIIGDGSEREKLQEYIHTHQLEKNVFLHGFCDRDYINKMLHQSSIYVMTSYTESFGIVLLEAMSYGLPCVAFSSAEGAREIIENEKTGYLIEKRSESDYIQKLQYLMKHKKVRERLGHRGREKVKDYTGEKVITLWLEIMEKR